MNTRQGKIVICILAVSLFISGCGPTQFVSIATGDAHTCGLTSSGGVMCWGSNEYGQLGDGTTTNHTMPVSVVGLAGKVTAVVTGGAHTCALIYPAGGSSSQETSGGGVKCWGSNQYGQLGSGSTATSTKPVNVVGLTSGVIAIAAGYGHTCAVLSSGGVKCWGLNGYGQLGNGELMTKAPFGEFTPVGVSGLTSGVSSIVAGQSHTCVLTLNGGVKCWGYNEHGQLGNGSATTASPFAKPEPVDVSGLTSGVSAITIGNGQTCALTSGGGMKCWGTNGYGELGDGTITNRAAPVDVSGLTSGVSAIAAGYEHTCALMSSPQGTSGGGVKCWGGGRWGKSTNPYNTYSKVPVDVSELASGVSAIAAGHGYTCVITLDEGIKCWGLNGSGQLGDGTTTDQPSPVDVKR